MGRYKDLLHISLCASAWAMSASLVCAQQTPDTTTPVTPTTPEAAPGWETAEESRMPEAPSPRTSTYSTIGMSHPGEPMIDEDRRLTFPNRPLLITGSALLVLAYAPAVIWQASEDRNQDLYIPVAGPWMDFASGDDGNLAKTLLVADGALQGLGALMTVSSLFIPERRTRSWLLLGPGRALNLAPTSIARGGYGLIANGSF